MSSGRNKKSWRDLTRRQQAFIVTSGAVEVGMAAAAWWDLARRPAEQVRGPKWCWGLAIAVNVVGPVAYFTVGRRRDGTWEVAAGEAGTRPGAPGAGQGAEAPAPPGAEEDQPAVSPEPGKAEPEAADVAPADQPAPQRGAEDATAGGDEDGSD